MDCIEAELEDIKRRLTALEHRQKSVLEISGNGLMAVKELFLILKKKMDLIESRQETQ